MQVVTKENRGNFDGPLSQQDEVRPSERLPEIGSRVFEVLGAGFLEVSAESDWRCAGQVGPQIGMSWGRYGYCAGVMGMSEVRALRDFLTEMLDSV